jgi:phage/plasmid-associated DNA primase
MFIENGFRLDTPEVVKQATERYRQQEDWLQTFLSECCTVDVHVEARCGELYSSYKEFSLTNGDYIRRLSDFNAAMAAAGFQQISRRGNRKYWRGVCPIGSIPSYRPTQATGA